MQPAAIMLKSNILQCHDSLHFPPPSCVWQRRCRTSLRSQAVATRCVWRFQSRRQCSVSCQPPSRMVLRSLSLPFSSPRESMSSRPSPTGWLVSSGTSPQLVPSPPVIRFGDSTLQDQINIRSLTELTSYCSRYRECLGNSSEDHCSWPGALGLDVICFS